MMKCRGYLRPSKSALPPGVPGLPEAAGGREGVMAVPTAPRGFAAVGAGAVVAGETTCEAATDAVAGAGAARATTGGWTAVAIVVTAGGGAAAIADGARRESCEPREKRTMAMTPAATATRPPMPSPTASTGDRAGLPVAPHAFPVVELPIPGCC